jgi:hypothetical protein
MMGRLEEGKNYGLKLIPVTILFVSLLMMTVQTADAQLPEHCGYSFEHRCVVEDEDEKEKILEVFPDAIVEVNEELYESIPEEDREDAEGIIESGAIESDDSDNEESSSDNGNQGDSDDTGSSSQQIPLPVPQQPGSSTSLQQFMDECMAAGNSRAACEAIQKPDFGICEGLNLAGVPCPVEQGQVVPQEEGSLQPNHIDECMAAGNSRAACENIQKPDFGICEGLSLANVPCPVS